MNEEISGIILEKRPIGETGMLFFLFSKDKGLVALHKRVSSKKASALPDIFNEICAQTTKAKTGELLFLGEFEILKQYASLAKNYENFNAACELSKFIQKNIRYLDEFSQPYKTFEAALESLQTNANSSIIKIKFLYLFAKMEGFPIKEAFAKNLNSSTFAILSQILSTPALECNFNKQQVSKILENLEIWIYNNTDIVRN